MAVPAVNILIEKNTDFSTSFKLKQDGAPINLNGYTISSKMRRHHSASTSYEFVVTVLSPTTSGLIKIGMASSITSQIPSGRYVYDVLATYSGTTTKVIEGTALVKGTSS